jgi:SAM-dependent methyltransferase
MMAEKGEALSWAERSPIAPRRRAMRASRIVAGAGLEPGDGLSVLDVGCGTGSYTLPLALGTAARVYAIDVTPEVLPQAKAVLPGNATPLAAEATRLPFPDETFDAIVGNAVLHHLLPLDAFVPELLRVLKPKGRFCFAEPNLINPHMYLQMEIPYFRAMIEASPDEHPFVRWTLRSDLERLGLLVHEITPFDFMYPAIPERLIGAVERLGTILEATPLICEIAGSLLIRAEKPAG